MNLTDEQKNAAIAAWEPEFDSMFTPVYAVFAAGFADGKRAGMLEAADIVIRHRLDPIRWRAGDEWTILAGVAAAIRATAEESK